MRPRITLFLFLFLYSFSTKAQKNIYPEKLFDYGDYYYWNVENIRGSIKKVSTVNFEYTFNKEDSTYVEYSFRNAAKKVYVDINEVFEFDRNGNLLKSYYVNQDSERFLNEENKYNNTNQLIFQRRRTRHHRGKKKIVHEQKEKRSYTSSGKIKEVWKKSSYQKDYFIKKKYTYNENDFIIKLETFNAHITTDGYFSCKGGAAPKDYVDTYTYDNASRLIERKRYVYRYHYDEPKKDIISSRDFSMYDLNFITLYEYNENNLISKETSSYHYDYRKGIVNTLTYFYDAKNRLVKKMTIHKAGHGSGYMYEYHEKEGELDKIVSIHIEKKIGIQTILKRISGIRKRDADAFISIHYNKGREERISHYNKYGDEILDNDLDDYVKRVFQYSYDKHGNWTSRILLENGIKKEKITRTLEYYSE